MKTEELPLLYVKPGCPWCQQATEVLDEVGIGYREIDVSADRGAFNEMVRKSGQSKAPTLDWHGEILADFGADELKPFLQAHDVKFEDS